MVALVLFGVDHPLSLVSRAHPFQVDQVEYQSLLQFMVAERAKSLQMEQVREKVLRDPDEIHLGGWERSMPRAPEWEQLRYLILIKGLIHKLSQHAPLRSFLLGTEEKQLRYVSPNDSIYGTSRDEGKWKGQNIMGYALQQVRKAFSKICL